jgi:competence protein ComEC
MLIDGGYAERGWEVVEYLQDQGVEKLDLVVGTHPHGDHIGATPEVMANFPTEEVWSGPITYTNATVNNFRDAVADQGLTLHYPKPGETTTLGDALITVLGPVKTYYEDVNDLSLVLMVEFGETRFLLTGDMEQLAEGHMMDYWGEDFDWSADVLKVGHHGSYSSTGYRLLRAVAPTWGIISCGRDNEYGHPHAEPLSRLRDAEVTLFRTDLAGTIIAASDGETIAFAWSSSSFEPYIPK